MKKFITTIASLLFALTALPQQLWTPATEARLSRNVFDKKIRPTSFKLLQLNETLMRQYLKSAPSEKKGKLSTLTLEVPNAEGILESYSVVEAPVMEAGLAAKYPGIRSYAGKQINGNSSIRFDVTPAGFHAVLMSFDRPTIYIDPLEPKSETYIVVSRSALPAFPAYDCRTKDELSKAPATQSALLRNADDARLRQYRIAVAASGEYSQGWLDGSEPDDNARRSKVIAAINTNLVRVNAIMERDFGARFNLIANNDQIVYLNAATDPFGADSDLWNGEAQSAIDGAITSAGYDIGHLVTEKGDFGNAGGIGTICNNSNKGSGYTSRGNWRSGIYFEEYILTHEMGHQCDANHTFSHKDEGTIAQVEPGSGTSIMSYAGITGAATDIIPLMDDYFHAISIQQATDYLKATGCGASAGNGNAVPTANAGSDYTIPQSTPFKLTGSGSDADGDDVLSFVWEQMDVSPVFPLIPNDTRTSGPQFRSRPPSASTSRTFPILASILDGTNKNKWEVLSSVDRTLNFRFTVRDNNPGAGNNKSDDMVLTIENDAGPFKVTSPNSNVTWCPGTHTVTWDVANTDVAPINTSHVNILLSTDGGSTFPTTLAANTPNDGSENVTISCTYSSTARIKVEAVGNVYFDISNTNFTIGDNTPPTFTAPPDKTINKDATCNFDADVSFTGDVIDEADNCDNTLNATYVDNIAAGSCVGETKITRTWTLTDDCMNSTVKEQIITVTDITPPVFTVPPDKTIYKDANCNHDATVAATGDVTDEKDNCDNTLDATFSDVETPGTCLGNLTITRTWKLVDDCGNVTTKVQVITVIDAMAPVIDNISTTPSTLWPVNHKMVQVTVNYTAVDNCSAVTNALSVSSNQPVNNGGDGNTSADWQVVNDHTVMLRAERSGKIKSDRVYTIIITSKDNCGNSSSAPAYVTVPHNQPIARISGTQPFEVANRLTVLAAPNPSSSYFTLKINGGSDEPVSIRLTDIYGRVIETRNGLFANKAIRIDKLQNAGVYFAEIIQGQSRQVIKLLKE